MELLEEVIARQEEIEHRLIRMETRMCKAFYAAGLIDRDGFAPRDTE